jgi:hypothetical protein
MTEQAVPVNRNTASASAFKCNPRRTPTHHRLVHSTNRVYLAHVHSYCALPEKLMQPRTLQALPVEGLGTKCST